MSSGSRARGIAYATQTRTLKTESRKRAMPDNFGKQPTASSSSSILDAQLVEKDNKADATRPLRQEEKDTRNDAEKDVVDNKNFTSSDNNNQAPPPIRTTAPDPAAATELKSAFTKCWTTVDDFDVPPVTFYDKSSYYPFGFNLFQVLFAMENVLNGNEELRWISPMYFSLPVRVYYAVIFFVQVLRARDISGTLSKPDSSFLRAFLRRFKDTSCVIAGPLVPIFTNIASCLPDDKQYDTVYPSLPLRGTYQVTHEGQGDSARKNLSVDPLHHVLPSVPLVGSLLRLFCNTNNLDDHFNDAQEFVPVPDTGGDFAGIRFPAKTAGNWTNEYAQVLFNPAMMRPLPESEFRLREVHPHWRRAGARFFPDIPTTTPFVPEGPSGHTQLIDNFNWFEMCADMASIQSRFFSDSTNLSHIPVIGGRSTLVLADIKIIDPQTTLPMLRPTTAPGWYPDVFTLVKAGFKSLTPVLHQDDIYNAVFSLTNGTLNWVTPGNAQIGSQDAGHRSGPYWNNTKVTFQQEHARAVSTGLFNLVQTLFYSARPNVK